MNRINERNKIEKTSFILQYITKLNEKKIAEKTTRSFKPSCTVHLLIKAQLPTEVRALATFKLCCLSVYIAEIFNKKRRKKKKIN